MYNFERIRLLKFPGTQDRHRKKQHKILPSEHAILASVKKKSSPRSGFSNNSVVGGRGGGGEMRAKYLRNTEMRAKYVKKCQKIHIFCSLRLIFPNMHQGTPGRVVYLPTISFFVSCRVCRVWCAAMVRSPRGRRRKRRPRALRHPSRAL